MTNLPAPQGPIETDDETADKPVPAPAAAPAPVPDQAPRTLELRVHGVNNTTPAALLDLAPEGVSLVAGDSLGSFWVPTEQARRAAVPGRRGHVPPGIRREAYSWGGMVRTIPIASGGSLGGAVAGVATRVVYALILPFSLGNAAQWTRRLTQAVDSPGRQVWTAITSGLTRLFGFVLTLLFTTTAATLALDIGAAQCAAQPTLCGPLAWLFEPMQQWSPGQRLALWALLPAAAALALWVLSSMSRLRYDQLPGMLRDDSDTTGDAPAPPPRERRRQPTELRRDPAVLSRTGFWSNRITRHLARAHLAGALLLTAAFVATQASMAWRTDCSGLLIDAECLGTATGDGWFVFFAAAAVLALVGLLGAAILTSILPTMRVDPEEEHASSWPDSATRILLWFAVVVFGGVCGFVVFAPAPAVVVDRLYGGGMTPVVVVASGAVIALAGVFFRPWAQRRRTAWFGCGPAVFMTISLGVAVGTSSIVLVAIGDFLNDAQGPAALIGWNASAGGGSGLRISSSYVALGSLIVACVLVALALVLVLALLRPRTMTPRAEAWRTGPETVPVTPPDIPIPEGGVLPPSPTVLLSRIEAKRRVASRLHLVEPAVAWLSGALALAIVLGIVWTVWAYSADATLWGIAPPDGQQLVVDAISVGMLLLAALATAVVALLAVGATAGTGTRPLGIVWDIACFLPQTGHPFGPPCYAERAVPEIAGRINHWLRTEDRRVVLAAHSMGAVLAMSTIGLLASSDATRRLLPRVAVLTFGVQLRPFFGRMLPELLGPEVLGTDPLESPPGLLSSDPWRADFTAASRGSTRPPEAAPEKLGVGRISGSLAPAWEAGRADPVRWVSLWRLTDYLGYPALSTVKYDSDGGITNRVDRYAAELDKTGYMVTVGTHGEYYRTQDYESALIELRDELEAATGALEPATDN
ncbi:hypothetical protein [Microbacterium sp.]|uniref:hypothetical protein n=1 Tax=Microbacterium sp. TaxID=51671 RepID=UPI002E2EE152|nr:hypothetical protein [Microbacterium sp.]HEX5727902.1 hypothetical protein [Microbacterium sp.]